jgi:HEPN domain-containing protein
MSSATPDYLAWLDKADEDLLCINNELAAERKPWSVICFCAQQAAEKHLKAFLVFHSVLPERTHDLTALLAASVPFEKSLATLEADCRALNSFAVDIRYPDIRPSDEESMTRQAVAASQRICSAIRNQFPKT